MNFLLTKTINGRKKNIINNETKKEEEVIYLYSNPINNDTYNENPPSSVCEFVLGQKLGEGTFGTVRLGTNRQTGEKVAVKILDKMKISNVDDRKRIEREIYLLKKIHHPNIVKLFCVIETGSQMFIVMEYIKGNELFQYIVLKKKLEEEEACYFFLQIINCIDYLHKLKISHRDLKAENIIIEQKIREIKLLDFGLSNTFENGLLTTACGSPIYAAPEMLDGKPYKGSTVDIWSAGIILYYMLCGNFPFEDVSNDRLYKKILNGKFSVPKTMSKEAKDLINKILVVNPKKRITVKNIKNHPWILNYLL
jgi:5'-AMP-activated protein kinase catalytic alpha subunit